MRSILNESLPSRLMLWGMLIFSFVASGLASSALPAAQMKQEYFVRQEADEALLIRINAFEAEIEASVYSPERRLLLSSAMPQSRLVPVFQFISSSARARQLDIEVSSSHSTANSKFKIEFTRLSAWDERSAALVRAYSLLSFGMQAGSNDSAADWTVKINSLMSAGNTFNQFGMQELRLWSAYLASHLIYYRLHDYNMVLGLTREILTLTSGPRWQEIELATLQLRSAAMISLNKSGSNQSSVAGPDLIQAALRETAKRAGAMGYRFEQSQAIMQSALHYASQSLFPMALEQFQLALKIADSIGADELATGIRENIAQIHAGQGDDPATNEVLQEIETQLIAQGSGDELALNLLQQGRIFMRNYRYLRAQEVLLQALSFENDSSIRSQVNLELARVNFETGQSSDSLAYLQKAGISQSQASTYFLPDYQAVVASPSSLRNRAEAMYQQARSLARAGQRSKAINIMEDLIDEVLFLRRALPGVLGAWYWKRHEQLLEYYLGLQMPGSRQDSSSALESLLVLSKMRLSESAATIGTGTDALRALLAQAESAARGKKPGGLDSRISRELNVLRASNKADYRFLSVAVIRKFLRGLDGDEAVLTYHLTPSSAYAWLGRDGKVRQLKIANPQRLYADLKKAGGRFDRIDGPSPGAVPGGVSSRLLGPVLDLLPETVYLIPSGPLLGLPLDAMRVNGRYLAERHTIVNLLSFPANPNPTASLRPATPEKVFLAGHPQDFSADFARRLETSAEIQAVTDFFIGPGLHILQGAALLPDEFQGERFAQANLVHLAMPASIDLGHPERSQLELSEAVRGFGRVPFKQADIRRLRLQAKLVFLSASQIFGSSRSSVSTQAGVTSAFLDAGADAVIASLWTKQPSVGKTRVVDDLILGFYRNLETMNIAAALSSAKRQYLRENTGADSIDWARYQIFIN